MTETRKFTCILCPRGCALEVDVEAREGEAGLAELAVEAIRGNACKRGLEYGRSEVLDPRRSLTSTVRVAGLSRRRLPVRSSAELPLALLVEAARALDSVTVSQPVKCGEVLVKNLLGLGIDIVATDDIDS